MIKQMFLRWLTKNPSPIELLILVFLYIAILLEVIK